MRPIITFIFTLTIATSGIAAPLTNQRERPIYRGEPVGYWISRLQAKDWPTRLDGAHGLREAGPAAWPAVSALIAALDDSEPEVRLMVIQALGAIGPDADRALPRLETLFTTAKGTERCEALRAMLRIDYRSPATLKILRVALRDEDPGTRDFALYCSTSVPDLDEKESISARRGSPDPAGPPTEGLKPCAPGTQPTSLTPRSAPSDTGLEELALQPPTTIHLLLPMLASLLDSNDLHVRTLAYYLLKKHDPKAIETKNRELLAGDHQPESNGKTFSEWLTLLRLGDERAQVEAMANLEDMPGVWLFVPALLDLLETSDDTSIVRKIAMQTIGHEWVSTFLVACGATDNHIRAQFMELALSRRVTISRPVGLTHLLLTDADPSVRIFAAIILTDALVQSEHVRSVIEVMHTDRAACLLALRYFRALADQHRYFHEIVAALVDLTCEADPEMCREALRTLLAFGVHANADRVFPALARTIRMDDPECRRLTVELLGLPRAGQPPWCVAGGPIFLTYVTPTTPPGSSKDEVRVDNRRARVRLLIPCLRDPVADVRRAAAQSLANLGTLAAPTVDALRTCLRDDSVPVRLAAAEALWTIEGPRCSRDLLPVLRAALHDLDGDTRRAAVERLIDMGRAAEPAFDDLVALIRREKEEPFTRAAARLVKIIDDPAIIIPIWSELLADPQREDRDWIARKCADGFGGQYRKTLVPGLISMLETGSVADEAWAIVVLGQLGPDARAAVLPLLRRIAVPEPRRDGAIVLHSEPVRALMKIMDINSPDEDAAAFLMLHAFDTHSPVFPFGVRLIPLLGPRAEAFLPYLISRAGELHEHQTLEVLEGLTLTEKSVPLLEDLLFDQSSQVRIAACNHLRKIGPAARGAIPKLQCLLVDPDKDIVHKAAVALLAIEDPPTDETRQALLEAGAPVIAQLFHDGKITRKQLERFRPFLDQLVQVSIDWLADNHKEVHAGCLFELLAVMGESPDSLIPDLLETYLHSAVFLPDGATTDALTIYLRSQGKAALPPLAHALRDPNEFIRMRAIAWLGLLGPDAKDLAEEIREAMHHRRGLAKTSEQKYLSEAVQTLAALGLTSKEYVRDLAKLLDDRDPCVQRLAARTIGSLGAEAKAALPALQQLPDSVDPLVLIAATEARMRIDGDADRATQILDHILADASQKLEVRAEAVAALCRMGPKAKAAMATFATLARSTSATERTWAASAYLDIAGAKQTAISLCIVTFDHGQCEPEAFRLLARMQHSGIDIRAAIPAIIERGNELGIRKTDLPFDGDARKFFEQVLGKSSARGSAPEDWRQFWMNDQPSHLTPEHLHGGIGP